MFSDGGDVFFFICTLSFALFVGRVLRSGGTNVQLLFLLYFSLYMCK